MEEEEEGVGNPNRRSKISVSLLQWPPPHPLLLLHLLLLLKITIILINPSTTKAQSANYVGDDCGNTTTGEDPKPLTKAYQTNLKAMLSWLPSNAATSRGYNHTIIGGQGDGLDTVYGLYDCRGDVVGFFCQFCVSTASREVTQRCPNRASAVIWFDFCILRYSHRHFFGNVTVSPSWRTFGGKVLSVGERRRGEEFMRVLIGKATEEESGQLFFMDRLSFNRFGLVQCSRDVSSLGCRRCLEAMLAQVPLFSGNRFGWQVLAPSCLIKFDDFMFYLFQNKSAPILSDSEPGPHNIKSKKLIIAITLLLGSISLLSAVVYCFWRRSRSNKEWLKSDTNPLSANEESLNRDLPTIPLITILQSTDNFSEKSKLGEGGFGAVYKGILPDGGVIAVKRLSKYSGQGAEEFKNEVMFIAKLQHRNLVRLLGCCLHDDEKILVYEYLSNCSLDFHLFDDEKRKQLDWKLRLSIINGLSRGLLYLHEDSRLKVIHRDLKASNVLLDSEMNPKISDFGLARAFETGQNQENTRRVMGTYGYMAPEYAMEGLFSAKSDVFSFGVLVLEIICGKKNSGFYLSDHGQSLLTYTWKKWGEGKCMELMDSILVEESSVVVVAKEVVKCIHIGLLCVQEDAADRPTMSAVVVMLATETMPLPNPKEPAFSVGRMTFDGLSTSITSTHPSINDVTVSNILPR